jgi:hypothetical protein
MFIIALEKINKKIHANCCTRLDVLVFDLALSGIW